MTNEQASKSPKADALDKEIQVQRNLIRTASYDLTYGELGSMYESGELILSPEYQRLFRWTLQQQTHYIESLLLGFPVPAIFVAEDEQNVWELVDGLQRVSTVLSFFGVLKPLPDALFQDPLITKDTSRYKLLQTLSGNSFEDLSLKTRHSLKRAYCRVEVIRSESNPILKYEMFRRLNRGGAPLTPQEIRNCVFRRDRADLMQTVDELANDANFLRSTKLTQKRLGQMYDKSLVLRFLCLHARNELFQHDVEDFIDEFLLDITTAKIEFNAEESERLFKDTFEVIGTCGREGTFKLLRGRRIVTHFSVYLFDAVSQGVASNLPFCKTLTPGVFRDRLAALLNDPEFKEHIGGGGKNTRRDMLTRISRGRYFFSESFVDG